MLGNTHNTNMYLKRIVVAASTMLAVTAIFAASAQAEYKVIGTGGTLHVRPEPSLSAPIVADLPDGTMIDIVCQTTGDNVVGSTIWDKIDRPAVGYVADWYTTTPAVGKFSRGLSVCGSSPPSQPPSQPAFHCIRPSSGYETGTYVEHLSGEVCYNGQAAGPNWFHAELNKKIPFLYATITGSGAFQDAKAYAGRGAPPSRAVTIWANEYIHTPGVLESDFRPVLEEWRYPRITVNAQGVVHQCTWFTRRFNTSLSHMTQNGTQNCH
jgi:hypothetical protein